MRRASPFVALLAVGVFVGCSFEVDDFHVAASADDAHFDAVSDANDATSTGDAAIDAPSSDADVVCDPTLFSCAGACVDLASDSKNCGTCGHSCPSGQCKKGNCK